jgi:two-component system C4-dicarboxylate transport sensor histidine kinase DctB
MRILATGAQALRRHPLLSVAAPCLVVLLPGLLLVTAGWAQRSSLEEIEDRARRTLALTRAGLASELRRHEAVPQLLAVDPQVARFLLSERLPGQIDSMNRRLAAVNKIARSGDTYLMDPAGLTLAASNWDGETPFVGRNFGYRPYFRDALGGTLGRYFALGNTSRRRGFYFAAPVRDGASVLGVLAVKVDVTAIERTWSGSTEEILVTDSDDVVFMSNREEWVLHSLTPLPEAVRARIDASRRYDERRIAPLPVTRREVRNHTASLLSLAAEDDDETRYLAVALPMPEYDWTVHVLANTAAVASQVRRAVSTAGFAFAFLLLLLLLLLQRRLRVRERLQSAAAAKLELERRVRERTGELTAANRRLTDEIEERRNAEQELRRTQRELIQASKLSALGEMSAGMSHELNQPLAAIRSFSENAEEFIARGRTEDARSNLARIGALTERMARIISNLRTFARKDPEAPGEVGVARVLDDALELLSSRIARHSVTVEVAQVDPALCVQAESARLSQVLVNILANALDAMVETASPCIRIDVQAHEGGVRMTVDDNGPGIAPERISDIFDPFFTTKEVDQGLGLGLSISYGIVAGFGGTIAADNLPAGGARFTITLPRVATRAAAATPRAVAHGR